jgi:hypothetical protein
MCASSSRTITTTSAAPAVANRISVLGHELVQHVKQKFANQRLTTAITYPLDSPVHLHTNIPVGELA